MRKRYYCDYCEKTFIDDLDARKKHLESSYHIKLRNLHYEIYRDPETILKEESEKSPCRRFLNNGICQFSGICKYTHYTPEQLWELTQLVEYQRRKEPIALPPLETWLENYKNDSKKNQNAVHISWTYLQDLEQRLDLPPSLRKFDCSNFCHNNFQEWGA